MFGKIFAQIYDSSIAEDYQLRTVFQDMIILADINGVLDMTPEALSRRTNVPLEIVKAAITRLEAPDAKSRTPDHDGARIKRLDEHRDWGWMILNHAQFREIASEEQRRAKTLARVRKHRGNAFVTPCNASVTVANACNAMQKQMQSTEADAKGKRERRLHGIPFSADDVVEFGKTINPQKPEDVCRDFFSHYEGQRGTSPNGEIFWTTGSGTVMTNWKARLPSFVGNAKMRGEKPKTEKPDYSKGF